MATPAEPLYQLPLDEFTAARDALAARLKAGGDAAAASAIKRLRKPSLPAWAANQIVWHAEPLWRRLREAAAAMRAQYARAATAVELRRAAAEQREALLAAEARAGELLKQHGHADSPTVRQKVAHTLLALAYGAADVVPGAVDHELAPPGFESLGGIALAATAPAQPNPPRAAPAAKSKGQTDDRAHRRVIAQAKARHAASREALAKARSEVAKADAERARRQGELDAARRVLEAARARLQAAEAEEKSAESALQAALADDTNVR
jgi:hypothetical protein